MTDVGSDSDGGWSKRCFDIVIAILLSLALAPVTLLCAMAVLLGDGRPISFRQNRVGQYGRLFRITKFRTMRPGPGTEVTAAGDRRVTRVGRWLRRLKLDELPQLWNVVVGEMSLVGPRPEVPSFVAAHREGFRRVLTLRPGLTDWASLAFHDEEAILHRHRDDPGYYERVLVPRKLALTRLYRRNRSLLLDMRLLAATCFVVFGLDPAVRAVVGGSFVARARRGVVGSGRFAQES